eukprot:2061775-Rhodomonas_salina.1
MMQKQLEETQKQQERLASMVSTLSSQIASLRHNEVDPWEGLDSTSSTSTSFRSRLKYFYGSTMCLLTPMEGTAAHIWPRSRGFCFPSSSSVSVNHPKNGMFLVKAIEEAFDRRQVCFICDPFTRSIAFKVLNPKLKEQQVGSTTTFGKLDGKCVHFDDDRRPSFALLSRHAQSAIKFAMCEKMISDQDGGQLLQIVVVSSPQRERELASEGGEGGGEGGGGDEGDSTASSGQASTKLYVVHLEGRECCLFWASFHHRFVFCCASSSLPGGGVPGKEDIVTAPRTVREDNQGGLEVRFTVGVGFATMGSAQASCATPSLDGCRRSVGTVRSSQRAWQKSSRGSGNLNQATYGPVALQCHRGQQKWYPRLPD